MEDIKLFIGEPNYVGSKLPWIETIDSVLRTQVYIKNKYLYRTVIIFKKVAQTDINYTMTNDVVYTTSHTDYESQHIGADLTIYINANYDYFDGNYYYSYLVMYSNVLDTWNVVNDSSYYAVLYDQTSVNITYPYEMGPEAWRITKNVRELVIGDLVENVTKLIIPNYMPETTNIENFYNVSNCEKFELFNTINQITEQEIETYNGLLYNLNQNKLIAVPQNYKPNGDDNIILSSLCTEIAERAFSNGTPDVYYPTAFNMLYGQNVTIINNSAFAYMNCVILSFPNLEYIYDNAISNMIKLERIDLSNTLISMEVDSIIDCDSVTQILFQVGLGTNLTSDLYLHHCPNLDKSSLALQFYNLATIIAESKSIYLNEAVYNLLSSAQIAVATDKGWKVEIL